MPETEENMERDGVDGILHSDMESLGVEDMNNGINELSSKEGEAITPS